MGGCWKEQGTDRKPAFISDRKKEASSAKGNCLAQRTFDAAGLENKKGERPHSMETMWVQDKGIKIHWAGGGGTSLTLN